MDLHCGNYKYLTSQRTAHNCMTANSCGSCITSQAFRPVLSNYFKMLPSLGKIFPPLTKSLLDGWVSNAWEPSVLHYFGQMLKYERIYHTKYFLEKTLHINSQITTVLLSTTLVILLATPFAFTITFGFNDRNFGYMAQVSRWLTPQHPHAPQALH
jgi:hypothetical protein